MLKNCVVFLSTRAYHKGGGKYIVSRFKLAACLHGNCSRHVFPMVSNLDYSLLKSVVINNDFEVCLRDMSRQGGSWLFCCLIGTSTVLIKVQD